ncbi:unnamed protein product [Trichobilharzia regenti]|nr:unnamed protein product [Trichobilharzia regenti]
MYLSVLEEGLRLIVDEHNDEAPIRSPSPPCNPIATTSSV